MAVVLGQLLGYDLLALIRPLLHPKDQGNLPFFSHVVRQHVLAFLLWFSVVGPSSVLLLLSLHRQQWGSLFAVLVAFTFSTFLLVNNVFQPIVAEARTFGPFMGRVTQRVGPAPLFFHKAFDNGALYYAGRHIPSYDSALVQAGQSFFFLTWEDEWRKITAPGPAGLHAVDMSEGTGPKGNHHLVLVEADAGAQLPATTEHLDEEDMAEDDAP